LTLSRLQQIENMLKDEPDDSFLNYSLALEYVKINELKKAIEIIETLLKKDENYLGAYYQLGKLYEETQQPDKAITAYKKGITIAQQQTNKKAVSELNQALLLIED
jgi:predicted Zn-dependent protease